MGLKGMSQNRQDSRFTRKALAQTEACARGTVAEGRARADAQRVPGRHRADVRDYAPSPELPGVSPGRSQHAGWPEGRAGRKVYTEKVSFSALVTLLIMYISTFSKIVNKSAPKPQTTKLACRDGPAVGGTEGTWRDVVPTTLPQTEDSHASCHRGKAVTTLHSVLPNIAVIHP